MIIMLCRNNVELSKQCFATLLQQTERTEILLIDNASTDGTNQWVKSAINQSGVFRISEPNQVSVAEAWNRGLRWAASRFYNQALVVNNDTELRPDTYAILRTALNTSKAGMVTCVSVRDREAMGEEFKLDSHDFWRPHPDFSCFMLAKWAYEKVGPFDEKYEGAFFEDNNYHVRMHCAGVRALNCGLPFLHHGSQTIKRADPDEVKRIQVAAAANQKRFQEEFGCLPGTEAYDALFTEDQFGSAAALTHSAPSFQPRAQQSE